MAAAHWSGKALIGPDSGIRFNWRFGRFIKSYLSAVQWRDAYYYLQAQAYWVLANWKLFERTGRTEFADIAFRCSEEMIYRQRGDGAWDYPNPEWRHRVATAEGTWGSLALLETSRRTGDRRFLSAAQAWHEFLLSEIGFEEIGEELAVNYFAGRPTARIPNNSAFVLRFLAELADVSADCSYTAQCRGMVRFMTHAQRPTGEFPYMVRGRVKGVKCWEHFQCYQYNAFECLDLMRYHELTGDLAVPPLVSGCLRFLSGGLAPDGHAFYDCGNRYRYVIYHTGALAAAFSMGGRLYGESYDELVSRAYCYLLRTQRASGSFPSSRGDYHWLHDDRSYPRTMAMILFHLLIRSETSPPASKPVRTDDI